jgi:hypothetical protein
MDRTWLHVFGLGALGLSLLGCAPTRHLEGPSTDEFRLPPENDPTFSRPAEYPKDVLNQGPVKKNYGGPSGGMGGPGGPKPGGGGPGGGMGPLGGAPGGGGF